MSPASPTRPGALLAVHVFLRREDEVLLLRRSGTGYEDGNYSVIAGHVEAGEQVLDAARREAHEEAGIVLDAADLEVVGVMHRWRPANRVDFFLTAHRWSGQPSNREPHKCDDLRWFPVAALPTNTVPYVRRAIGNHLCGRWFDSFDDVAGGADPGGQAPGRATEPR